MHLNMCMHTNKYTAIKLCNYYFASFFGVCVIHMCICIEIRLYLRQIYKLHYYIIIYYYIYIYIYESVKPVCYACMCTCTRIYILQST